MKRLKNIFLLLFLSLVTISCESWLKVTPFDQLIKEDVYATEKNTQSALNGLYLELSSYNLYAGNLTATALEVLAKHYQIGGGHRFEQLNSYSYGSDTPKQIFNAIWTSAYKTIAECNEFLTEIEKRKSQYPEANYNIYYGEVLAIRTLLHFDLLRLFGPVYSEGKDQPAIPYYRTSDHTTQPVSTAEEVMTFLLGDIDKAIDLLKKDAILEVGVVRNHLSTDFLTDYRCFRMNFYAVNALKARMALYKGDEKGLQDAYLIASSLLNGENPLTNATCNFWEAFRFYGSVFESMQENVHFTEMLFCIQNVRRETFYRDYFSTDQDINNILAGGENYLKTLYESGDGRVSMWTPDAGRGLWVMERYLARANAAYPYHAQLHSVIRLTELYLIASEAAPSVTLKREWLEKMRIGRNFLTGNTTGFSDGQLDELIEKEYIRETYGEGQYFFFLKRKNINIIRDQADQQVSGMRGRYQIPLPESETNYR